MTKYFICHAGGDRIPDDPTDEMGVIGELYRSDGKYARSPDDCRGRDADIAYWGVPDDSNDNNGKSGDECRPRKIFIDLPCFTEISAEEYKRLHALREKLTAAQAEYQNAVVKYLQ